MDEDVVVGGGECNAGSGGGEYNAGSGGGEHDAASGGDDENDDKAKLGGEFSDGETSQLDGWR